MLHLHERRRREGGALKGEAGRIGQSGERQCANRLDVGLDEEPLADRSCRVAHGSEPLAVSRCRERGVEGFERGNHRVLSCAPPPLTG
jgi:hypothetical protein